ncbi:MAG: serine--tRNA ligase [Chitinophagales bacterium]
MLELSFVRNHPEEVKKRLSVKVFDRLDLVDSVIALDQKRRSLQQKLDENLHESKLISKEIGQLYKQGKRAEAEEKKSRTSELKEQSKKWSDALHLAEKELKATLILLPNLPHESVPTGYTPLDNLEVRSGGSLPQLDSEAKPHWELAEQYGLMSLELGVKVTGAGFPVYMGKGARLQRALINFFLDEAIAAGFTEMLSPHLVNEASAFGTGNLPDKEGQMYYVEADDLYLIPTAEVPLTNMYRGDIVAEDDLPIKIAGYTPCFRREAGSYGAHVRGLNRVHQFDKVEIVQITHPDNSYEKLDEMVAHVESLLHKLELPYRILALCGGDASFTSALTYDFETYSAAQKRWLEVSSVSNFETFQSNRMKLRFRDKKTRKTRLTHTLNGSALALPRILATLLENNQTPQGIVIPEVLRSYTGFDIIS